MKNKSVSTKFSTIRGKSLSGWDLAISEAKRQISELKRSIRTFQDMRDKDVPWPGEGQKESGKGDPAASQALPQA